MLIEEMTIEQAIQWASREDNRQKYSNPYIEEEKPFSSATMQYPVEENPPSSWEEWQQLFQQGNLSPEVESYLRSIAIEESRREATAAHMVELFRKVCQNAAELFERKNIEYDNAIEKTGVLGAVTALTGDMARLRCLVLRSADHGRVAKSNVRDKAQDVMIQAAICILMLDSDNFEGKG